MQRITLVVHAELQQELADCLRSTEHINTFLFTHVEEHSSSIEQDEMLSAHDKVVGYVPQVKVDILVDNSHTSSVLGNIRESNKAIKCKGIYWISDVVEAGTL